MQKHIKTRLSSGEINFTPYGMARISEGLLKASENYYSKKMPVVNYFLICASIEIGLKSIILSKSNSNINKKKIKKLNHDLIDIYQEVFKIEQNIKITDKELEIIKSINPHFKNKGLEYLTGTMIEQIAHGLSNFPNLKELTKIALKIHIFIDSKNYFNNL